MKRKLLTLILSLLTALTASAAYDFEVDGIYYNRNGKNGDRASVTYGEYGKANYFGSVIIPSTVTHGGKTYSVTSIGTQAFYECSRLTSVTLPEGLTSIGGYAFDGCSSLTSINIPESVTSIGGGAFRDCSSLTSINIPDGVTSIGYAAFYGCSSLTSVTLPESLTSIDDSAFGNCYSLTSITLPESLTRIGEGAFWRCSSLTSITLPEGLTSIGNKAFYDCYSLTYITSLTPTPPTCGSSCFAYVPTSTCVLYVPAEAVDAYRAAGGWNDFVNIEPISIETPRTIILFPDATPQKMTLDEVRLWQAEGNQLLYVNAQMDEELPANVVAKNAANKWTAKEIRLNDGQTFYCPKDVEVESITYTRTFGSTDWQAIFLPFELQESEWTGKAEMAYISDVKQYDDDKDKRPDRTTLEFFTVEGGRLRPNVPYIVKPNAEGETVFAATNTTLKATPATDAYVDCSSTTHLYAISGTYQPKADMYSSGAYALSNGGFYLASSNAAVLAPFRVYLTVSSRLGEEEHYVRPQRIELMVDGEDVTGIEASVARQGCRTSASYDLTGRRVQQPQKGIFIRDGKKLVIR